MHLEDAGHKNMQNIWTRDSIQDMLFLWATRGQHSGQFIGSAEVCASLLLTKWSAIGFFWLVFVFFVAFDVYLYVRDRDGFMWSSSRHFVCFTMVECTRLLFDVSWGGVHSSRALDAAQGMFHMDSSEFPYRQFSSRDLTEEDKVWGSRKKGGRREGLYESSRAVNLVDGLPRAPSWQIFWKSALWWAETQFFEPCRGLTHHKGAFASQRDIHMTRRALPALRVIRLSREIWPQLGCQKVG